MLIKKPSDMRYSEVTPKHVYLNRRQFIAGAAAAAGVAAVGGPVAREWMRPAPVRGAGKPLGPLVKSPFSTTEKETPYKDVTNYNNYYEFSTDKYRAGAPGHELQDQSLDRQRRRQRRQAAEIQRRRSDEARPARRAHLPPSLRRGLVHRGALDWILAERADQ